MSSLVNVTKLRGHAPLSILRMNLVEKISFPASYVIGLTHHSPLSILQMKPWKCFVLSMKTSYLTSVRFHMATRDSPFHHAVGMQTFHFHFQFSFLFLILSFLACVKMKLKLSIVPPWFKLVKKWTHLRVINLCDHHAISLLSLGHVPLITSILLANHTLPLGCLPFFEEQLWRVVLLASLFTKITMFWEVLSLPKTNFYPKHYSFLKTESPLNPFQTR